jgi:DNA replicative helicase MCM subunit Mcm2 (Cdc46/Mcm family)
VSAAHCLSLQGSRKGGGGGSSVPLRGEIHVLMVGDPGLGKSKLLQVHVRCRQVCLL